MTTEPRSPDFIIAGAPRSGTTWLCNLLARHSRIAFAQPIAPEPKFFLVDALYERGLDYYRRRWFAGLDRDVLGEKSTNYLEDARCAGRIAEALPAVKLIFVLRNPVERAFSNYRWSRQNGLETEAFRTALAMEGRRPVPHALRYARPFDYLSRGCYADLLRPYLSLFPRGRILLLRFDEICRAPESVAAQAHGFLGVEPRPDDASLLAAVNQADAGDLDDEDRRYLQDYYAGPNRDLRALTGLDVASWND